MVTQSRLPTFLLTRPAPYSEEFAEALRLRLGPNLKILISPLLKAAYFAPSLPEGPFSALIFTSRTGVEAYRRLGNPLADTAFCVGDSTAAAARDLGLVAISAKGDANDLLALIRAHRPQGRILHLHGREVTGNLAGTLQGEGIDATSATIYAQEPARLSQAAGETLRGDAPVILPVFSPRSAAILSEQIMEIAPNAPLLFVAISRAAADQLHHKLQQTVKIATKPDATALIQELVACLPQELDLEARPVKG